MLNKNKYQKLHTSSSSKVTTLFLMMQVFVKKTPSTASYNGHYRKQDNTTIIDYEKEKTICDSEGAPGSPDPVGKGLAGWPFRD
jgi:hypothetical protein